MHQQLAGIYRMITKSQEIFFLFFRWFAEKQDLISICLLSEALLLASVNLGTILDSCEDCW